MRSTIGAGGERGYEIESVKLEGGTTKLAVAWASTIWSLVISTTGCGTAPRPVEQPRRPPSALVVPSAVPAPSVAMPTPSASAPPPRAEPSPFHFAIHGEVGVVRLGTTVGVYSPVFFGVYRAGRLVRNDRITNTLAECSGSRVPPDELIERYMGDDPDAPFAVMVRGVGDPTRHLLAWDKSHWRQVAKGDAHTFFTSRGPYRLSISRYYAMQFYGLTSNEGKRFNPAMHPLCQGATYLSADDVLVGADGNAIVAGFDACDSRKGFGVERFQKSGGQGTLRWYGNVPFLSDDARLGMLDAHTLGGRADGAGLIALDLDSGVSSPVTVPSKSTVWDWVTQGGFVWVGAGAQVFRTRDRVTWKAFALPPDVTPVRLMPVSEDVVWVGAAEGLLTTANDVTDTEVPSTCP